MYYGSGSSDGGSLCFYDGKNGRTASGDLRGYGTLEFFAQRSNSIYGNSATVQPKSLNLSILIKYQYLIRTLRLRELGCTVVDAPQVEFDLEASKLASYIAVEPEDETPPVLPYLNQDKQPFHFLLSPLELEGKKPKPP